MQVTDEVWPRFPFVTNIQTTTDRYDYVPSVRGRGISIRNDSIRRTEYRLKWMRKKKRFVVVWRHRDAPAPFHK